MYFDVFLPAEHDPGIRILIWPLENSQNPNLGAFFQKFITKKPLLFSPFQLWENTSKK